MIIQSFAKVNLVLDVLYRRPDGYHQLNTVFQRISLYDSISLEKTSDGLISVSSNASCLPCDERNLCYKSASLLKKTFRSQSGVRIFINKRIPISAGLGGGSSNAASVLCALNVLWKLNVSNEKLVRLGRILGADVPFFIYGVPFASATGRGDIIKPWTDLRDITLWHVLVVPDVSVSTPLIFKKWDSQNPLLALKQKQKSLPCNIKRALTRARNDVKILHLALREFDHHGIRMSVRNDLESSSLSLFPEIIQVKEALLSFGVGTVKMSGSGPSVYGLVSSRKEAQKIADKVQKANTKWKVFVVKTC